MLVLSAVLASVFLARQEMVEFLKQLLGTLTFSSNFVLWRQTGYFDTSSALKLLLHTWPFSRVGLTGMLHSPKSIERVALYSFKPLLCDGSSCRTELDGVFLYPDEGHFSPLGSRIVGQQSDLNALGATMDMSDGR